MPKRNNPGCKCCMQTSQCQPCPIPPGTLYLSWTYYKSSSLSPTIHTTLTGSPHISPSFDLGDGGHHYFEVRCDGGQVFLIHHYWAGGGTGQAIFYDICYPMAVSTFSCSPFSADWSRSYTGRLEYVSDETPSGITICGADPVEFSGGVVNQDLRLILTQ